MTVKMTMIAFSAVVALAIAGPASVAQAGGNSGDYTGGFKIGPLGQVMGSSRPQAFAFGYAPRSHRRYVPAQRRRYGEY